MDIPLQNVFFMYFFVFLMKLRQIYAIFSIFLVDNIPKGATNSDRNV